MSLTPGPGRDPLELLIGSAARRELTVWGLTRPQREALSRRLRAHLRVHRAQGHDRAFRALLVVAARVAAGDPELEYRLERARLEWLDQAGRLEEALHLSEALSRRWGRSRRDPDRGPQLLMERAILLHRAGRSCEALALFRRAARRYRDLGDPGNQAAALCNAASVLYDLGRYQRSLRTCQEALAAGAGEHPRLAGPLRLQQANSHEALGSMVEARTFYEEAAEAYRGMGRRREEAEIRHRLGWLWLQAEDSRRALQELERALELSRELDYGAGLARYHLDRARSYREAGILARARHHYRACLGLAAALDLDELATEARLGLCRLSESGLPALPDWLKHPPPPSGASALARSQGGEYCQQIGEGAGTPAWSPRPTRPGSGGRGATLLRVLEDLVRLRRASGIEPWAPLERQRRAVEGETPPGLDGPGPR